MWQRYVMVFVCFLIDSIINVLFPVQFGNSHMYFVSCIGFSAVILNVRHMDFKDALILSAFAGIFYDIFYANTMFLYFIIFMVSCCLVRIWVFVINESIIENVMLCISTIFVRELVVYLFMIMSNQTTLTLQYWMSNRIALTLIVNGILVLILVFVSYVVEDYLRRKELQVRKEERLPWMH